MHRETGEHRHVRQANRSLADAEALVREMEYGRRVTEIRALRQDVQAEFAD